jgi:hypothetical protein
LIEADYQLMLVRMVGIYRACCPGRTCLLRIEPYKLVELLGMKNATSRINDVHLPASLK